MDDAFLEAKTLVITNKLALDKLIQTQEKKRLICQKNYDLSVQHLLNFSLKVCRLSCASTLSLKE